MLLASEYISPCDRDFVLSGYGVVAILLFLQGWETLQMLRWIGQVPSPEKPQCSVECRICGEPFAPDGF